MTISEHFFWSNPQRASQSLEVFLLGQVDFASALQLQERFREIVIARGDLLGGLFVCEHPPVITIGREGSQSHLKQDRSDYQRQGIDTHWLNRGGGTWLQCPGQVAVYPIIPLRRHGWDVAEFRTRLESAMLDVCREFQVPAHRLGEEPGLFCKLGQLAALGIAIRSWVSTHGMTLNVRPDLSCVRQASVNERGIRATSMEAVRQRLTAIPRVRESVIRNFAARLGYKQTHVYTQIQGLKRTSGKPTTSRSQEDRPSEFANDEKARTQS